MSTARITEYLSEADYLEGELHSEVRHEYVDGNAYAVAGARVAHNRVAVNVTTTIAACLKGRPCEAFNSDMKVRIQYKDHTRFYYPDAMVVCESNDDDALFQDKPVVIVEVLSESTKRADTGEKFRAYRRIESLTHYLLIEPESASVVVYERDDADWKRSQFSSLDDTVVFEKLGIEVPLADVYERVLS